MSLLGLKSKATAERIMSNGQQGASPLIVKTKPYIWICMYMIILYLLRHVPDECIV